MPLKGLSEDFDLEFDLTGNFQSILVRRYHTWLTRPVQLSACRLGHSSFSLPRFSSRQLIQNAAQSPASDTSTLFPSSRLILACLTLSHHESQRFEPSPICHLIAVPSCRDSFKLPYSSESRDTFSKLPGYNIRQGQRDSGGHRECR